MAVINPVGYLHNLATHTAQVDRLSSVSGLLMADAVGSLRPVGGRRSPSDLVLSAPGGMVVRVGPGLGYVPQGQSALGGGYAFPNDGNVDLAIGAAHATLPRRDLICARVQDAFYAGSANLGDLIVIPGTAATTPTDPALPVGASYLVLGRVAIAAAAAAITIGNITPLGTVAATNSYLPFRCTAATRPDGRLLPEGFEIWETDTKARGVWDPTIGASGGWLHYDTKWQDYTPQIATNTVSAFVIVNNGILKARFFRQGRLISLMGYFAAGTTTSWPGGNGSVYMTFPPGYAPFAWSPIAQYHDAGQAQIYTGSGVQHGAVAVNVDGGAAAGSRRMVFWAPPHNPLGFGTGSPAIVAAGHSVGWNANYETNFEA